MIDTRTSYLIGRADRILRGALEQHLAAGDLSLNEVTALSVLEAGPGLSNAALARRSLVSPQAMHKVVRSLESAGLIERTASPNGGRSLETTVTARGVGALAEAEARIAEGEAAFLEPLTRTERQQLRSLLLKVARLGDA